MADGGRGFIRMWVGPVQRHGYWWLVDPPSGRVMHHDGCRWHRGRPGWAGLRVRLVPVVVAAVVALVGYQFFWVHGWLGCLVPECGLLGEEVAVQSSDVPGRAPSVLAVPCTAYPVDTIRVRDTTTSALVWALDRTGQTPNRWRFVIGDTPAGYRSTPLDGATLRWLTAAPVDWDSPDHRSVTVSITYADGTHGTTTAWIPSSPGEIQYSAGPGEPSLAGWEFQGRSNAPCFPPWERALLLPGAWAAVVWGSAAVIAITLPSALRRRRIAFATDLLRADTEPEQRPD